jgi:hypothetical protein
MSAHPVEWVLVVRYGKSAHRATYGRLSGGKYTKDFIQLHRNSQFLDDLKSAFPALDDASGQANVTYEWPSGSAQGKIFLRSADRPHLAWETNSAPQPWRMREQPTLDTVETIRGNPSLGDEVGADSQHDRLSISGFGLPFLIAVKLRDEVDRLHLRVLVENPLDAFAWADLKNAPIQIRKLAAATSQRSALAWRFFSAGDPPELFFNPDFKSEPWIEDPTAFEEGVSIDSGTTIGTSDEGTQLALTADGVEESDSTLAAPAPALPTNIDFSKVLVDPPKPKEQGTAGGGKGGGPKKVDHSQKAQSNDAVGKLGEEFALTFERWRLRNHPKLAKKLRHVSKEDDTLGYDIESFELDGTPRFIEVKGTLGPMETRFFLSASELACAEAKGEQYIVLRVAQLATEPKCCEIRYPFEEKLELTPATYSVGFAAELVS